jgi:FMN phosphatase YigB (HAD superfamily)
MAKIILTDADGVLFDWVTGFREWALQVKGMKPRSDYKNYYTIEKWYAVTLKHANELVTEYNASAAMGFLEPYEESAEYVKKLNIDYGYRFVVITAMGYGPYAERLRWVNLRETFGDVFEDLHITDLRECKGEYLQQYKSAIWIEDHPSNAEKGLALGHRTFLFDHVHNAGCQVSPKITRVHTWKELYEAIANETETEFFPTLNMGVPVQ